MNTNEVQTEPLPVQPGSYTADALAASVEEKFAALFRQVHPPICPPVSGASHSQARNAVSTPDAIDGSASGQSQFAE